MTRTMLWERVSLLELLLATTLAFAGLINPISVIGLLCFVAAAVLIILFFASALISVSVSDKLPLGPRECTLALMTIGILGTPKN